MVASFLIRACCVPFPLSGPCKRIADQFVAGPKSGTPNLVYEVLIAAQFIPGSVVAVIRVMHVHDPLVHLRFELGSL
jgi:hypothetical protein